MEAHSNLCLGVSSHLCLLLLCFGVDSGGRCSKSIYYFLIKVCMQLRSLVYIRKEVGPSNRWPTLSFNKWDTSRATGAIME